MRTRGVLLLIAALAPGLLAACGSQPQPGAAPVASPTRSANPFLEPGLRFSTEADQAYLAALGAVDERLARDGDALGHGRAICVDLLRGRTDDQVAGDAAARFGVDNATAREIVAAVKRSMCKV